MTSCSGWVVRTSQPPDVLADLQQRMFQLRLIRWLRGVGYPASLRGTFISEEEFVAQKNNPLIRAERFLYTLTEMLVLPLDASFNFTVFLYQDTSQEAGAQSRPPKLNFHDCVTVVDVPLNEWMDNVLLQPADFDDGAETEFDAWMSSEFSLQGGDYNSR
ncbi:hypothetical protein B0H16DRAFT_1530498 [Mycena metata]|uniref:Uncharacterized protein n=1 Tax=Mycena metata TaxID=1033252 RepID=A0AAD7JC64_9AGAR|nr:hypothetical protein B0H16DRAFT_1530498 [Mycena metata]